MGLRPHGRQRSSRTSCSSRTTRHPISARRRSAPETPRARSPPPFADRLHRRRYDMPNFGRSRSRSAGSEVENDGVPLGSPSARGALHAAAGAATKRAVVRPRSERMIGGPSCPVDPHHASRTCDRVTALRSRCSTIEARTPLARENPEHEFVRARRSTAPWGAVASERRHPITPLRTDQDRQVESAPKRNACIYRGPSFPHRNVHALGRTRRQPSSGQDHAEGRSSAAIPARRPGDARQGADRPAPRLDLDPAGPIPPEPKPSTGGMTAGGEVIGRSAIVLTWAAPGVSALPSAFPSPTAAAGRHPKRRPLRPP